MNEHNVAAFKSGLVAWPLNESEAGVENLLGFLMLMMLFSSKLIGIYLSKAVRSPSKRGQHQPHFHSKARQLSTQL